MIQPVEDAPYALVVDDDFVIRIGARDMLEDAGFRVFEAEDGDSAYALMEARHRDVVLLFTDVQMPGTLDGFALARAVARSWPDVAIVIASGRERPSPGSMPHKARFIGKPFSAQVVHGHLREILPDGQKPPRLGGSAADR